MNSKELNEILEKHVKWLNNEIGGEPLKHLNARSKYDSEFKYEVGKIVSVDNFDEDRWNECAPGIHFFINRQEAVEY